MVKTAPTSSLVVAQTQFLLQFLIISFDDPALFGNRRKVLSFVSTGSVESQPLVL
jgi:hypothetical protein